MQSVMLDNKTAKLLESYSRLKKLSAEQAIAALLEEVTQRQSFHEALTTHWADHVEPEAGLDAQITQIIKQDRAKQRQQTGR